MHNWRTQMPAGMSLKSEGFASGLYDPEGSLTLGRFCAQNGLPYGDMGMPIPVDTLTTYGISFQKRFVPELEEREVVGLDPAPEGFRLRLDNGDTALARRVVVAIGITNFQLLPERLAHLPGEFLSHSFGHHHLDQFAGRDVTVLGAGASAIEIAAMLRQVGATPRIVARTKKFTWTDTPGQRSLWQRIRYPMSGMTPGIRSRFYEDAPMLFRYLPEETRVNIVKTFLGAAPPWWMKDQVLGRMPIHLGTVPERAEVRDGKLHMKLAGAGAPSEIVTDHVIAATGYRADVQRLPFLARELCSRLQTVDGAPALSGNFQSSVPGLYFVGLASANTFGPLMRFMLGAGFTARRLSAHLAKVTVRRRVSGPAAAMEHATT
jgi:NADPH-dependent 2,4-dienoyl-CoA reductase/sulfur reductase-like enzyme